MNPATKELLRLNLRFCGTLALIVGFLLGFLMVSAMGGFPSNPADSASFFVAGLMMSSLFSLAVFIALFLLSVCLQFALIYFRRGRQENNPRMLLAACLLFLAIPILLIPFVNIGGIVLLAIAGLWSLRRVNHWFRPSEEFPAETEKAKRNLDEAPEKAKRGGRWQPSRFLVYTLVLLVFACGAYTYLGSDLTMTNNVSELYSYGEAAFEAGNYGIALDRFNRAIERDPNFADAYIARGRAYYALDNYEAALADWAQAEALGADLPPELEAIRDEPGNAD